MSGFVWKDVKRDVSAAAEAVAPLAGRSYHFNVRKISPPAFIVDPPEQVIYHGTYGQPGQATGGRLWACRFPLSVAVGMSDQQSAEDELSDYIAEEGPKSLVAALEGYRAQSYSTLTVMSAEPVVMTIGGVQYLGAVLSSDVVGGGA